MLICYYQHAVAPAAVMHLGALESLVIVLLKFNEPKFVHTACPGQGIFSCLTGRIYSSGQSSPAAAAAGVALVLVKSDHRNETRNAMQCMAEFELRSKWKQ